MPLRATKDFSAKAIAHFVRLTGVIILTGTISPAIAEKAPKRVNLVTNGSFESPGTSCIAGSTTVQGWTVNSGNVDIINSICTGGLPAADGAYYLDLTGSHAEGGVDDVGTISQYLTTEVGKKYRLSFRFGGNPQATQFSYPNDSELKAMAVFLNGAIAGVYSVHTALASVTDPQWRRHKIIFTATTTSTEIRFQSLNGSLTNPSDFGPVLDDVDVYAGDSDDD